MRLRAHRLRKICVGLTFAVLSLAALAPGMAQQPPAEPRPATPAAEQQAAQPAPVQPRFLVLLDPAHGGQDRGALLGPSVYEKDVVLTLARRIRSALESRGIAVSMLREGDATIRPEQRALLANSGREALVISVHAGPPGGRVRVVTSRLAAAPRPARFLPWDGAQSAYVRQSRMVADRVLRELAARGIAGAGLSASLRPLNSVARPAIAVELAPPGDTIEGLSSPVYQQAIASAIAAAVAAARPALEPAR